MKRFSSYSKFTAFFFLLLFFSFGLTIFTQDKIGDKRDGSRSTPVHLIKLFDKDSVLILKNDKVPLPISTKFTCGECHSYNVISKGLHFSGNRKRNANRNGEPWIYVDWKNLTIIPLSENKWKGTFTANELGISSFKFLELFGTHLTGGGIGEDESAQDQKDFFRWEVSGKFEINCLSCHDANSEYDAAEFSAQMQKQNFKYAATAASNLADVKGNASKMPDNFDPYNSSTFADVDVRTTAPPSVLYFKEKFNENNQVFFDLTRKPKKERCYYCHSSVTFNRNYFTQVNEEEDVHLKKGMTCADCHRNGIDHEMIRGYRNEFANSGNKKAASYSCKGCHGGAENGKGGINGAPVAQHKGIPAIHFTKLECTVCHSGTLPEERSSITKTSRAHKLGIRKSNKQESLFPHIQTPVYVRNKNGMIEPSNLIWPSFWAKKVGEQIFPLKIDELENYVNGNIKLDTLLNYGKWHSVSDSSIVSVLKKLNSSNKKKNENFVFVSGGKIIELEGSTLRKRENEKAEAYTWPIGHSVRPAQQALGANGCGDCHSASSNFFFSNVLIESSLKSEKDTLHTLTKYQELNSVYQKAFSFSFFFRPWLKGILIVAFAIVFFVILIYAAKGFLVLTKEATKE